jgi:glutathione S-transferase
MNPIGKLPVLVLDEGEHLIDSSAIAEIPEETISKNIEEAN